MKIPTNRNYDTDFLVTNDQVANAPNKFRNHKSIIMIRNKRKTDQCFSFGPVKYDDILKKKKRNNLAIDKTAQQSHIPTGILKQNPLNTWINRILLWKYQPVYFEPTRFKISRCDSKKSKTSKDPTYLIFMKDVFMIKFRFSSILFCPSISAGFEKATMHNTA